MSFTTALENSILDALLGASHTIFGSPVELALSTTDPGTSVTEPSGGSYARVSIPNNASNWVAASSSSKVNAVDFVFPEATASWGTISHWAIYDAGTMKLYGIIDDGAGTPSPFAVGIGDTVRFLAGDLRIEFD